jgi:hypothetical protein
MTQASGTRRNWRRAAWWCGLLAAGAAFAGGLNDTGQTTCYDDTGAVSPEPGTHPRQDCTVGRDAAADGVLPKTGAGSKGFDYTKIANNGGVLPASATSWDCVRDNLTGLTWEVKTNDGGLRDRDWTYTWYDDIHTDNNGGTPGYKGSNTCGGTLPNSQCNTQAYVAAVNSAGLCGQRDWRMPTRRELQGLVDYGIPYPDPAINSAYFPYTAQSAYWSSSAYANDPARAWYVFFNSASAHTGYKKFDVHARFVRGGQ